MPKSRADVLRRIRRLQQQKKTIVFTNGCYDLVHVGHVRFLKKAKTFGDVLVLGLNSDASVRRLKGKTRPILPLTERRELLETLRCVDFVLPFSEDTPYNLIKAVQPDILIKGGDWSAGQIVGADIVKKRGGKVISGIFIKGKSTSAIVQKIRGEA